MDGLRGIAMMLVFLGHFGVLWVRLIPESGAAGIFLRLVRADATFGSGFFMLLSGFFGYSSLKRGRSCAEFFRGRILRLYPLYGLMCIVYIAGSIAVPKMGKLPPGTFNAALFILQTALLLPGVLPVRPLMDVAWTLSFIVLFYFIEAGAVNAFRYFAIRRRWRFVSLVTAGVLWAYFAELSGIWETRTAIFWSGMALLELLEGFSIRWSSWTGSFAPAAALIAVGAAAARTWIVLNHFSTYAIPHGIWRFVTTSIALSAFVYFARFGPSRWKRILTAPRLRQLGAASYSFYLTHGFAIKIFQFVLIPHLGRAGSLLPVFWASQFLGLCLSVYIALCVYRLIEQPVATLLAKPATRIAADARLGAAVV